MGDSRPTSPELNQAMLEAVDFVHAEGWDARPTLFGLVRSELVVDLRGTADADEAPLTLIVQDLPVEATGSPDALADYLVRIAWPEEVTGAILAQEIMFRDTASDGGPAAQAGADVRANPPRPARLFSGVLRDGSQQTLLQLRPTAEELAAGGPFAEDDVQLRGGPEIAPEVIAALAFGFEDGASLGDDLG